MSTARYLKLLLLCLFVGLAVASPTANPTRVARKATLTERDDPDPVPTICGDIIDYVNNGTYPVFYASDAYACLLSVPFDPAVALRFVEYYNTTILFQSTLAYLQSPPDGYQQPAVDVLQELEVIKRNITNNIYPNEYAFEAALQSVVYRVHDAHVQLNAGVLAAFRFASPVDLVTASKDGKEVPKVYFKEDIDSLRNHAVDDISPIVSINGVDVDDFLTDLAAQQSVGMLEPNADWNQLMANPARDIQGDLSTLGGGMTFYPGDELNFTMANGEVHETYWLAIYSEPYYTGPLKTGGDFYNYFVLGLLPASYNEMALPPAFNYTGGDLGDVDADPLALIPYNFSEAYPSNPDVVQQAIDDAYTGFVTGYFLNDTKTGVLSIPTFSQTGWDIGNFSQSVDEFIVRAKTANLSNVIIDLQQNSGGLVELAFVTFGQFFPDQKPFAGSRRRSHELANSLGQTFNDHWEHLPLSDGNKTLLEASEWVVLERLNADTGRNFTSWAEYYGPRNFHGDHFSLTERYDLANEVFDIANFDGWVPTQYTEGSGSRKRPWDPKDIVVLTDGTCSSTCALFTEMLAQADVRTVVVGGRPTQGPMQATAGTRGAVPYVASVLDKDFDQARNWSTRAAAVLPPVRDPGVFVNYATFNLRDQIRKADDTGTPLQFKYLPANCRLYFTLDNVFNMSALWRDVGHAAWIDSSLCVAGSTTADSTNPPDSSKARAVVPDLGLQNTRSGHDMPDPLTDGEEDQTRASPDFLTACNAGNTQTGSSGCPPGVGCAHIYLNCGSQGVPLIVPVNVCRLPCSNSGMACPAALGLFCQYGPAKESGAVTRGYSKRNPIRTLNFQMRTGVCVSKSGNEDLCAAAGYLV